MKASFLCIPLFLMSLLAVAQPPATPLYNNNQYQAPSQDSLPAKKFDPRRLVIGGNIGATFGDYTFVNLSPQVGYMFNKYLTAGVGVNYVFSSIKYYRGQADYDYKYNYSYAGMNIFGRFSPVRFLFLSAQPELNYNWGKIKYNDKYYQLPDEKVDGLFVPSFLIGAGAILSPSGRGGLMVSVQYDVIQYKKDGLFLSPYGNKPYLNIGFAF